jgi:hypothetical protein
MLFVDRIRLESQWCRDDEQQTDKGNCETIVEEFRSGVKLVGANRPEPTSFSHHESDRNMGKGVGLLQNRLTPRTTARDLRERHWQLGMFSFAFPSAWTKRSGRPITGINSRYRHGNTPTERRNTLIPMELTSLSIWRAWMSSSTTSSRSWCVPGWIFPGDQSTLKKL